MLSCDASMATRCRSLHALHHRCSFNPAAGLPPCSVQGFLPTVLEDVPDMAVKFAVYEMMRGLHNKLQVGAEKREGSTAGMRESGQREAWYCLVCWLARSAARNVRASGRAGWLLMSAYQNDLPCLQDGRPANVAEDLIMGGVAGAAAAAATTPLDVVKTVSFAHCSLSFAG